MSNRGIRYTAAIIFIFLMFLIARITGNKEIIFPEILAVLLGAWCTEKMAWKTGRISMVIVMTIAAFAGVAVSRFIPVPLYFKALIGFVFAALLLIISDSAMTPAISACLLPIYIGTTEFTYSFSVMIMMILIAAGQKLMVELGIKEGNVPVHYMPDFEEQLKLWAILFVAFMLLALYPLMSGNIFVFLPPIIVMFAESSQKHLIKGVRAKMWLVTVLAAFIGGLCQFVLVDWFRWPVFIAGTVSAALVLLMQRGMKLNLPPACAIAILPFIIPDWVMIYPFAVTLGSGVMLLASSFISKKFIVAEGR